MSFFAAFWTWEAAVLLWIKKILGEGFSLLIWPLPALLLHGLLGEESERQREDNWGKYTRHRLAKG